MLAIALATLRTRAGAFVGAFVTLACACALVAGCGMLLETGLRGAVPPQRYAAAPLLVAADQQLHFVKHKHDETKTKSKPATETVHLPESVLGRVRAVPGVGSAVPDVSFPATVLGGPHAGHGPAGSSWGHGWSSARLTPFALRSGHAPTSPGEVVLDADAKARVGDRVTIQTPESATRYRVVGVTRQALPGQGTVFFADATADRLAGDRLAAIGVWPRPGTDRAALVAALGRAGDDVRVYSGDARGTVEFRDAERARVTLTTMSGVLGGTALLVAILVVVGTFALMIEQRYQEIALLRAVGATPRQVRRMLSREVVALGVVAAGLGSLAGRPLAHWLHDRFVAYGAIPDRLGLVTGPLPALAAVVMTIGAGWLAARVAARRATRIPPAAALGEATTSRRLGVGAAGVGALLVAVGAAAIVLLRSLHTQLAAIPVTLLAAVACAAGLALLGPLVCRIAAAVIAVPLRLFAGTAGHLAAENTRADPRRLAAVVTPMTLAVAMAVTVLFVETTLAGAAHQQARDGTVANYALRGAAAGVPADVTEAARSAPGVATATQVLHSTVWIGKNRYPAQGVTSHGLASTMDLQVVDGSLGNLGEHAVAVSTVTADRLGDRVGDTLTLRLGDGTPVSLRIVATYARGLGYGALTLPYQLLAAHVDVPLATTVLVAAPASAEPALSAVAREHPGVQLLGRAAVQAQHASTDDAAARYTALGLITTFTAIAVVNTLAITTLDRRRELALLRLVGTTRRQALRMLHAESLAAALTALLLGGAIGAAILTAFAQGMTGSPVPAVPAAGSAAITGALFLLAFLGTTIPARITLRATRPFDRST